MSMLKLAKPRASNHPWSWSVVFGKIFFMPVLAIELDESLTGRYRLVAIKFVRSEAKRDTLPLYSQSILSREWLEKQRLVNGSVTTYQERCLCRYHGSVHDVEWRGA